MGTQRVQVKGICWPCLADARDFCSALAALAQPSSIFFLFKFLCPHRPASLAGRLLVQYVSLEVTKERPLSSVLRESSYKYHLPTHRYPFLSGWRQVRQVGRKHSSLKIPTIVYSLHYFDEQGIHILVHVRTGRWGPGKRVIYCLQIRFTH